MEDEANRVEYAVTVLTKVLKSEQERVETGIAIRKLLKERVARGLPVDHYRLDWLHSNKRRLAAVLQVFAREFNETHPKDKISNHDLVDLLTETINSIVKYSSL